MSKFILARYGTGSGGKFLCCLLQLSSDVNTWDLELEEAKTDLEKNHESIFFYFKKKFTTFDTWLKNEPHVTYSSPVISELHTFNHDQLNWEEAQKLLESDKKFVRDFDNGKKIMLMTGHSRIPKWLWNNTACVNMHIDNILAAKWVRRAMYRKCFKESSPGVFIPDPASGKDLFLMRLQPLPPKDSDQYAEAVARRQFVGSKFSFLKKYICKNNFNLVYKDYEKITAHPTNTKVEQIKFNISNIQSVEAYYRGYESVCNELQISLPNSDLVKKLIDFYIKLH